MTQCKDHFWNHLTNVFLPISRVCFREVANTRARCSSSAISQSTSNADFGESKFVRWKRLSRIIIVLLETWHAIIGQYVSRSSLDNLVK